MANQASHLVGQFDYGLFQPAQEPMLNDKRLPSAEPPRKRPCRNRRPIM